MNEVELQKQKQRGDRARQLMDDKLICGAFSDIRENIYKKISASTFDQSKEREDCYMMLRAIETFEGQFRKHINTGRAAEEKLSLTMRVIKRVQEF